MEDAFSVPFILSWPKCNANEGNLLFYLNCMILGSCVMQRLSRVLCPFTWRKVVLGGRVTRLPEPPWPPRLTRRLGGEGSPST